MSDFNPMPAITGRVCPTFCEPECKRGGVDEPVAIRCVERALGDYMLERWPRSIRRPMRPPARPSLSSDQGLRDLPLHYYLRKSGHRVDCIRETAANPVGCSFMPYRPSACPRMW